MTVSSRVFLTSSAYRMLATPFSLRRSASILFLCFVVLISGLMFIPWQQTAVGNGRVIAFAPGDRIQAITANLDGQVEKWFVSEGEIVKEGDLLVRMSDNDPEILKRLTREREALAREIDALGQSVALAEKNRERQEGLLKKKFSTANALEQAGIAEATARRELAEAEGRLAQLDTRIARQMMQDIRAPRDGTVQNILVGENSGLISAGTMMAQLVPETRQRTVELFLSGLDLPFIRVGQDVRLQFRGWPILQFSGLPQLSTGTFLGEIQIIDPSDNGQGNFRVIVAPKEGSVWPSAKLLRQGVRARGWVQMNQVPLWYEVWRLINDLPPFTPPLNTTGAPPSEIGNEPASPANGNGA